MVYQDFASYFMIIIDWPRTLY